MELCRGSENSILDIEGRVLILFKRKDKNESLNLMFILFVFSRRFKKDFCKKMIYILFLHVQNRHILQFVLLFLLLLLLLCSPARSLGFTIFGEIFACVTVF